MIPKLSVIAPMREHGPASDVVVDPPTVESWSCRRRSSSTAAELALDRCR